MKLERIVRLVIGSIFYAILALTVIIISPILLPLLIIKAVKFIKYLINTLGQQSLAKKKIVVEFELNKDSINHITLNL